MTLPPLIIAWLILWLAWLSFIDIKTGLLPNWLTISGIILGLTWHVQQHHSQIAAISLAIGYLYPCGCNMAYRLWRRHDGLGQGDVKMIAMISTWVTWITTLSILILACALGCIYIACRNIKQPNSWHSPLPFGPCLALATIILLLQTR